MKHLVIGIILILLGVWGMVGWWDSFAKVMRGLIPFFLLAFGAVAALSGSRRLDESDERDERDEPGAARPRGFTTSR